MSSGVLGKCLAHFTEELKTFIFAGLQEAYKAEWEDMARNPPGKDAQVQMKKNPNDWDLICLVNIIHDHWDVVFSNKIVEKFPKAYFTVVKFYRNRWAHQNEMNPKDIYRAIDIMQTVLEHINLNYAPLQNALLEIGYKTEQQPNPTPDLPSILKIFLCYKCYRDFEMKWLYKCIDCHIILCPACLRLHQFEPIFKCPKCKRLLDNLEIQFASTQYG